MDRNIDRSEWTTFFKEFSVKNRQRPTRLEILDELGVQVEEHGMPFAGVDLEWLGDDAPRVELMFGDGADSPNLSHTMSGVSRVQVKVGPDGRDEVLDLEGEHNVKTLLHLEKQRELPGR